MTPYLYSLPLALSSQFLALVRRTLEFLSL